MPAQRLDVAELVSAYAQGLFPMDRGRYADGPLRLYRADPRAVLPLPLRVPRSIRRALSRAPYRLRVSAAFAEVVRRCARWDELPEDEIWLSERIAAAYGDLHELGIAQTLEAWDGGRLAAGVLTVNLGRACVAETMFHAAPDAGHVALVRGVELLAARGVELLDVQVASPHVERLGAVELPAAEFEVLLARALGRRP